MPLAGTVLCGIAVQFSLSSTRSYVLNASLLFVSTVFFLSHCVYFAVIFGTVGVNAFMLADSLRMIQQNSFGAFFSGSPAWITLTLPSTFAMSLCFFLGALYWLVMAAVQVVQRTCLAKSEAV
jgi:hypothetical protein